MQKIRQQTFALVSYLGLLQLLAPMAALSETPKTIPAENPATLCDRAAVRIAGETGTPLRVLRKITRARSDTGQTDSMALWPWTVNVEGKTLWFDTETQAQSHIFRHFKKGARSFDIGCFRLNYKWHAKAFNSIEEMFDPILNARHAAAQLAQLHNEHEDWATALAAYHSRTHYGAQPYLRQFAKIRASLAPVVAALDVFQSPQPAPNTAPPNQHTLGSLVPGSNSPADRFLSFGIGG
jgi:hypothetical protein